MDLTLDNPDLSGLNPVGNAGVLQGSTTHLLPGWNVTLNGSPLSQMYYSPLGVGNGGPYVTLTQNASSLSPADIGPYSLRLTTYVPPPPFGGAGVDIRMSQIGEIPANATGIKLFSSAGPVAVLIDGIPIAQINNDAYPTLDVSAYAGKTVNLEFRFPQSASFGFDIRGFTTTVPEPSAWALFGFGAGIIGWGRGGVRNSRK
jgi:hypothetical protein